jgi:hypothetical protein
MKKLFILLLAAGLLIAGCTFVTIQGSGNVITETREVRDFDTVSVCCGMQLRLTQGADEQLTLEGEDNILNEIETNVSGGTLTVRFRRSLTPFNFRFSRPVIVHLTMKTIHGVSLSGGASVDSERMESDRLDLAFSGGSHAALTEVVAKSVTVEASGGDNVEIESLTADTLNLRASGGSHLTVDGGTVGAQQITASGGSQYWAEEVQSTSATVNVSGGSEARISVSEALQVTASGGSRVEYTGDPAVEQELSGGSEVRSIARQPN